MGQDDWNDLQAFLAVARAGQLVRAARGMAVDPTTIGRRLRRLEARLGKTLFEQTRDGHVLTEAGETMLADAEAMEDAAGRLFDASRGNSGPSGLLRVSLSEGFGALMVARHIGEFAQNYPDITLDLVASNGFLSPSRREADLAVMLSRPRKGPLVAHKLSDYALHLYGHRDYIDRIGEPKQPSDLTQGHQLAGYIPDLIYAPELNYLDELHPGLEPQLRLSSIIAQYQLVAAGGAIGILPAFIARANPAMRRLLPDWQLVRSFWIVTHEHNRALARVRLFSEWLEQLVHREKMRLMPPS